MGCRDESCNIQNCITCAGNASCSICDVGYKYNTANRTCDPMSCTIVGCAVCSNATCTSCMSGYTLRNQTCLPACDPNCDTCTSPNNCGVCRVNYIFDYTIKACKLDCSSGFVCSLNTKCIDTNCKDCGNNTDVCLYCKTGYKLSNGTCSKDICNIAFC